jgi:hypothetical protein
MSVLKQSGLQEAIERQKEIAERFNSVGLQNSLVAKSALESAATASLHFRSNLETLVIGIASHFQNLGINNGNALAARQAAVQIATIQNSFAETALMMRPYLQQLSDNANSIVRAITPALIQMRQVSMEFQRGFARYMSQHNEAISSLSTTLSQMRGRFNANHINGLSLALREIQLMHQNNLLYDWDEYEDIEDLSEEDETALFDITEVVVAQPKNWQVTLNERLIQWGKTKPILAWILLFVILQILTNMASSLILEAVRNIPLRSRPESGAEVLTIVQENQHIEINDEVPYWYEVAFENAETKEICRGWLPKRFVRNIENKDAGHNEATSTTGENCNLESIDEQLDETLSCDE